MKLGMALVIPLAVCDVVIAVVTTLGCIPPIVAGALLLANPLVYYLDHRRRARRSSLTAPRA
jgi:hypothetical protein